MNDLESSSQSNQISIESERKIKDARRQQKANEAKASRQREKMIQQRNKALDNQIKQSSAAGVRKEEEKNQDPPKKEK